MDTISRVNQVMEYIELHLKDDIMIEDIEHIMGCSYSEFQRMFTLLNDISFQEYIRTRRMSQAAIEIIHTKHSILSIALEYGYESGDSFTVAFRRLYGCAPSTARKQPMKLNLFHPRRFTFSIHGLQTMEYNIVSLEEMELSGVSTYSTKEENKAPAFWSVVKGNGVLQDLFQKGNTKVSYGVCFGYDREGNNRYMIAVEGQCGGTYERLHIPKATWMIFEGIGPLSKVLSDMWKNIYVEVLPNSNYDQSLTIPTIEKYYEGDCENEDYKVEIWIPVIRNI